MRISVFGLGYVGSVTAACLAEVGHEVIGVDIHAPKVSAMREGRAPVSEPGLEDLLKTNLQAGRIRVTTDTSEAVHNSECAIVAVGTPSHLDGSVDLQAIERCIESIAAGISTRTEVGPYTIVIRSTVPPGTADRMLKLASELSGRRRGIDLLGGMNPEFLREGSAVQDFFAPSLIVIGADDDISAERMRRIYAKVEGRVETVPTRTAELVKYANNAFHATKIVFANEIDRVSRACGVEGMKVMELLCLDDKLNISTKYLKPGFAYGGSCLPKDLRGLNHLAERSGVALPMMKAVISSNDVHIDNAVDRVLSQGGRKVGLLGVTFKAGTDDVRESPALTLARRLTDAGVEVKMFDVNLNHELLGANRRHLEGMVPDWAATFLGSAEELIQFADTVVITTSEDEYYEALGRKGTDLPVVDLTVGSGPMNEDDSYAEASLDTTT